MGSALCKAGFVCGRERPSIIFPTINWEDAERVWHHLFVDQLRVAHRAATQPEGESRADGAAALRDISRAGAVRGAYR